MANEFIARKGLIVLANGATVTGSLKVSGSTTTTGNISAVGYHISASLMSASTYYGDGSQLTGVTATGLDIDNFGADLTVQVTGAIDAGAFDNVNWYGQRVKEMTLNFNQTNGGVRT